MIRGDESPPSPEPKMLVGPLAALVINPNCDCVPAGFNTLVA
jgi:hypothetical protein